jgi:hypothetical protein
MGRAVTGDPRGPRDSEASSREGWWTRAGYASLKEWLDENERLQNGGRVPLDLRNAEREVLGLEPIPESEVRPVVAEQRRSGVRQVGLKLAQCNYEALAAAANPHGVAPTTMARLLLKRALAGLQRGAERAESR